MTSKVRGMVTAQYIQNFLETVSELSGGEEDQSNMDILNKVFGMSRQLSPRDGEMLAGRLTAM